MDIAYQLYGLRDIIDEDPQGTFEKLAAAGYETVEFVGSPGHDYQTAASLPALFPLLEKSGLHMVSSHVTLDDLELADTLFPALKEHGCEYTLVPFVAPELRQTRADISALATKLNAAAATAKENGLRFGYHHHAFEFEPFDGTTVFDLLEAELDTENVFLELDVYWITRGGREIAAEIAARGGRVPLLHVKDMADGDRSWVGNFDQGDGAEEKASFVPVGTGFFDWPAILAAAREVGTEWLVIEQDFSTAPFEDAATSLHNLRELLAAE
jgi:sugar phosphate isomerase/epimerase